MFSTIWKNLVAHKVRLIATSTAVLLGVALMSGTLVLTATMQRTFDTLFSDVYKGTDAVVRAKASFEGPQGTGAQRGRVDASLVAQLAQVPGVEAAEGSVVGYARLIAKDGHALGNPATGAPTLGINWSDNPSLNSFRLVAGTAPKASDQVVIDKKSSRDGHLNIGDTTTVLVAGPPQRVVIAGIARFGTADSPGGASVVAFTPEAAQRLIAAPGKFDAISFVADKGVSQTELVSRLSPHLPAGLEAVTGKAVTQENQSQIRKGLSFFNTFLLIFAVVALLVGGFMISNAFSITVAQRTRENGLLRALGASRRQILLTVVGEALAVGVVASALGVIAGIGVALGLKALLYAVGIDIPATGVVVTPPAILISVSIGIAVTVLAALSPARKAAKVPPIAAMQLEVAGSTGYGSKQRVFVGLGVLIVGVVSLLAGLFAGVAHPVTVVGMGALLVFFAVSILGRTVSLPMSRVIGWPLPRTRGITGEIARDNAMRNPKRTAASASALMIGVGLVGFITIFVSSTNASIERSVDKAFTGDIVLDSGGGLFGGVDPSLAGKLSGLPEVSAVSGLRQGLAQVDGKVVIVQAGDPATIFQIMRIDPVQGSASALADRDAIAVYRNVARDRGWTLGSKVPVVFAKTGAQTLRVGLIYGENAQAGNYFLGFAAYRANYGNQFDSKVLVKKAPPTPSATALAAVRQAAAAFPGVKVLDRAEYKREQIAPLNRLLALVYALLGLAILIALLGITNTLALAINERTRELGLLRAVGMTRSQLRSSIRWESVIIALQGTVLGLLIGTFFGWALVRALHDQGITVFRLPVVSMLIVILLASLAGVVAAVPPSRRAAKLDVLHAVVSD